MRAADIVTQLATLLPVLEDGFTSNVTVASITRSSTVMTAKCLSQHGLEVGHSVLLTGALTPIAVSTLGRSGVVGTLVTAADHDLTEEISTSITLSGATESNFNGAFDVLTIPNRRTVRFTMADADSESSSGTRILENGASYLNSYDGLYAVTSVPSDTDFTFIHPDTGLAEPVGSMQARMRVRIAAAITAQRATDLYTAHLEDEYWLFVVLDGVAASKNRLIDSDGIDNTPRGARFRQQLVEGFSVLLFMPVSDELAAESARDVAGDLFRSISRSLTFSAFDTQLSVGVQNTVQFVGHDILTYNGAVYVHGYQFQQVADLLFEDTVGADLDVAFRDISLTLAPVFDGEVGSETSFDLNLDDTDL